MNRYHNKRSITELLHNTNTDNNYSNRACIKHLWAHIQEVLYKYYIVLHIASRWRLHYNTLSSFNSEQKSSVNLKFSFFSEPSLYISFLYAAFHLSSLPNKILQQQCMRTRQEIMSWYNVCSLKTEKYAHWVKVQWITEGTH